MTLYGMELPWTRTWLPLRYYAHVKSQNAIVVRRDNGNKCHCRGVLFSISTPGELLSPNANNCLGMYATETLNLLSCILMINVPIRSGIFVEVSMLTIETPQTPLRYPIAGELIPSCTTIQAHWSPVEISILTSRECALCVVQPRQKMVGSDGPLLRSKLDFITSRERDLFSLIYTTQLTTTTSSSNRQATAPLPCNCSF